MLQKKLLKANIFCLNSNMEKSAALKEIFKMKDWSPAIWARKTGFSINQIVRWQKGLTTNIRPINMEHLAYQVGEVIEWIDEEKTDCAFFPMEEMEEFADRQTDTSYKYAKASYYERVGEKSYIPVLSLGKISRGIIYRNNRIQSGIAEDLMLKPKSLEDPQAYAVRVTNETMVPALKPFSHVIIDTTISPKSGDLVVIKLKKEPALIAEYHEKDDKILLKQYNPFNESESTADNMQLCHKIVWIKTP